MNLKEENNLIKQSNKIHFIGIGGIGLSAIARMMILEKKEISGSDREPSAVIKGLKKFVRQKRAKCKIFTGHKSSNLDQHTDLVVYTTAIAEDNPELKKAKKLEIPSLTYPQALGLISKEKYTIAVSGAHGKTTTTAMLGKILKDAKKDPTIIVGSLFKDSKSNLAAGKSKYLVCEACEYKKAFLNLSPKIIVITNIDNDHLDYYKNLRNIQKAFYDFVKKLESKDYLVYNGQDKNSLWVVRRANCRKLDFSKIKMPKNFKLKVPGKYNIQNAKAALATAKILKINKKTALNSLARYPGVWRRFEYKGKNKKGVLIYDDYAHHPTEIRATLESAREIFKNQKIFCVFQPHLFSRTKFLLDDFAQSFKNADSVIIAEIYAAREKREKGISSKIVAQKIPNAIYIKTPQDIEKYLNSKTRKNDVVFTIGAGDVYKIGENLLH